MVKPIDRKELAAAVEKARVRKETGAIPKNFQPLFQRLSTAQKRIGLPTSKGVVFVHSDEILRCESDSNYTLIILSNGERHIAAKTLKEFESLLAEYNFVRVHQSHLVNPIHIKQFVRIDDGGEVVLSNGTHVEVSRRNKDELLERMAM